MSLLRTATSDVPKRGFCFGCGAAGSLQKACQMQTLANEVRSILEPA